MSTLSLSSGGAVRAYHRAMQTLGQRLRHARSAAGISREEMARRLGKSGPSTVSNWENDRGSPSVKEVEQFARICGVEAGPVAFGAPVGTAEPKTGIYALGSASQEMAAVIGLLALGVEKGSLSAEEMHALAVIVRNLVRR